MSLSVHAQVLGLLLFKFCWDTDTNCSGSVCRVGSLSLIMMTGPTVKWSLGLFAVLHWCQIVARLVIFSCSVPRMMATKKLSSTSSTILFFFEMINTGFLSQHQICCERSLIFISFPLSNINSNKI